MIKKEVNKQSILYENHLSVIWWCATHIMRLIQALLAKRSDEWNVLSGTVIRKKRLGFWHLFLDNYGRPYAATVTFDYITTILSGEGFVIHFTVPTSSANNLLHLYDIGKIVGRTLAPTKKWSIIYWRIVVNQCFEMDRKLFFKQDFLKILYGVWEMHLSFWWGYLKN